MATTTTNLPWNPMKSQFHLFRPKTISITQFSRRTSVKAFQRSDLDNFARRVASGEAWRDAWRSANNGFELFVFEARKTAERLDRRYSIAHRLSSVVQSATERAREIDRDYEIRQRWRTFSLDFSRNWPRYRKQLNALLDTPLGRSFAHCKITSKLMLPFYSDLILVSEAVVLEAIFFLWFALSGWLFRCLIFATWILPFAGPLLIGTLANNFIIKGDCPACKRQFVGYKNQIIRCVGCGNTVWQPKGGGGDFFSGGKPGGRTSSKAQQPDIIDVEFEEK